MALDQSALLEVLEALRTGEAGSWQRRPGQARNCAAMARIQQLVRLDRIAAAQIRRFHEQVGSTTAVGRY